MLIVEADRLVEADLRQRARVDVAQKVLAVLQMLVAVRRAGRKPRNSS